MWFKTDFSGESKLPFFLFFFSRVAQAPGNQPRAASGSTSSLSSVLHKVYVADILWAIEMIKCNFSGLGFDNKFKPFQRMFLDKGVAKI